MLKPRDSVFLFYPLIRNAKLRPPVKSFRKFAASYTFEILKLTDQPVVGSNPFKAT